ncbi:MAG: CpsD/CapB family tyrosine-protein kinase [Planctomycetota bacterium]
MGRIAEALKRAEQERKRVLDVPGSAFATATLEIPTAADANPFLDGKILPPDTPEEPRAVVQGLCESLVPFFERSSLVTEQYRSLRTRLLSQNQNYEHRILAITSAVPKEGKSVTTLNLGCILAEINHLRVLVVDGDFRRSSLARMLCQSEDNGPGLADVLRGEATYEQVIRKTPIPNLSFIPAGKTKSQSAAQLLTAACAKDIFKRMQHDFHYTIVDTPPATTVTDVGILGHLCSGVIVIVRLNRTHELAAKRAVRLLKVNNIPIVGCLLVGRDSPTGRYGYGYGYGYAYNYYRYYNYYNKNETEE